MSDIITAHSIPARTLLVLAAAWLAACGDDGGTEPAPIEIETVEVTPAAVTLTAVGQTHPFTAQAIDTDGNTVDDATFEWTSSDTAIVTVDASGVATARGTGSATITATTENVSGTGTATVDQTVAGLGFRTQPDSTEAGEAMSPAVQVEVRDSGDAVVSDADIPVTLELADTSGGARLHGTTTVNAVNGVASFSGLSIERADTAHQLVATSTGLPDATSASFPVTPLDPVAMAYLTAPMDSTTAGEPLGAQVAFRDTFGNVVTWATDTVTIELADTAGAALIGATAAAPTDGVARFDTVTIEVADTGYTLLAAAANVDTVASPPFAIRPAAPNHIAPQQLNFTGGVAEGPTSGLEYVVADTFGNVVDTATTSFMMALSAPAFPGTTMDGRLTTSAVNGVAVFDSVVIDKPGTHGVTVSATGFADLADSVATFLFPSVNLQLAAGGTHTCTPTGTGPFCWGSNGSDQLGAPLTAMDSVAVASDSDVDFELVSADSAHSCGISDYEDGQRLYCWGANGSGQLGIGATGGTAGSPTPVQAPAGGPTSFTWVSAGARHTCAVGSDFFAYCWGDNSQGQLGIGTTGPGTDSLTLVTDSIQFLAVAAGANHTCGIRSTGATDTTQVYCWGDNASGQLGDGASPTDRTSPVQVGGTTEYVFVDAGRAHTCAVEAGTGDVDCWGANDQGQLGDGSSVASSDVPVATSTTALLRSDGTAWGRLAVGSKHACAVAAGGIECWGDNDDGQLGTGSTTVDSNVPVAVDMTAFEGADPTPPMVFQWIAAGGSHSCTFEYDPNDADGDLILGLTGYYCWGANGNGQLGNGTTLGSPTPVRVIQGH